jgi:hypothetical protein
MEKIPAKLHRAGTRRSGRYKEGGIRAPVTFQVRVAEEMALLPEGSAIAEMLADYNVMRDQARTCVP